VIRGLSGPRVMVLQNGVGQVDASSLSPDHAVASDPGEASRVEVLRGPSTLAYGGSGIGGVVNIIDDRVPSAPPPTASKAVWPASAVVGRRRQGDQRLGQVREGPAGVRDRRRSTARSGDYDVPTAPVSGPPGPRDGLTSIPDQKVKNTDVEVDAYGAGVSYVHDSGFFGASIKKTDTTYGVPYSRSWPRSIRTPKARSRSTCSRPATTCAASRSWTRPVRQGPSVGRHAKYEHAEVSVEDGEVGTRFLSNGTEGRLELVQKEHDGWQGAVGFQALERHFEAIGDEAFVPSTDIKEYGVFTLQRLDKGDWGDRRGPALRQPRAEDGRRRRATSTTSRPRWACSTSRPSTSSWP
jgi:iron complex outermembrane receptor protein